MPELPEVETIARTLYPHIHNCVFSKVELLKPSTQHPWSLPLENLVGRKIYTVRRRGKLLILDLNAEYCKDIGQAKDDALYLVIHLRMTGRLFTREANMELGKHTRCLFGLKTEDGRDLQLFFDDTRTFGKILLANPAILDKWPFWNELGPEPLEISPEEFGARLKGNRAIKAALLDQKVIAGIGNIYADESLFHAKIHPARAAGSLSPKECGTLLKKVQKVLNTSISQCGSSIRDYRDADGNAGAFQNTFYVYGRAGEKCKKCGEILQKCRITGRSTVFCPNCQK